MKQTGTRVFLSRQRAVLRIMPRMCTAISLIRAFVSLCAGILFITTQNNNISPSVKPSLFPGVTVTHTHSRESVSPLSRLIRGFRNKYH